MKILPVGAAIFHADKRTDGRTDKTTLAVFFAILRKAPKNIISTIEMPIKVTSQY